MTRNTIRSSAASACQPKTQILIFVTLGLVILGGIGGSYITAASPEQVQACVDQTNWTAERCEVELNK